MSKIHRAVKRADILASAGRAGNVSGKNIDSESRAAGVDKSDKFGGALGVYVSMPEVITNGCRSIANMGAWHVGTNQRA